MIVHCYGGISNRLRVILSYRAKYGEVDVVWLPDGEICGARFLDVFEPIAGVRFIEPKHESYYRTCDPAPDVPPYWQEMYGRLTLRLEYHARWLVLRPSEPYDAIHVRRTDHHDYEPARLAPTTDETFYGFLSGATQPVWLATDNGTTQLQYMRGIRAAGRTCLVCDGIHVHERENMSGQRNTTLADAAIDLFMCAGAVNFFGSRHSSFTNAIHTLRNLTGWWT